MDAWAQTRVIYTQQSIRVLFDLKEKGNSDTRNDTDEPQRHHAK